MEDDTDQRQPQDISVFVDGCDGYVGSSVARFLIEKGFKVFGFGENKFGEKLKLVESRKAGILSAELSVFDMTEDPSSVSEALEIVNSTPLHKKVNLVIFSPLLCWGGRSTKPEGDDEDGEKKEEEEEKKEEEKIDEEKNDEDEETEPFEPVSEEDYLSRVPHEIVKEQYRLESRALQLNQEIDNLIVTIFGVGLLYGSGENILFPIFRALWENKMNEFPVTKSHISCMNVMNLGIAVAQMLLEPIEPEEKKPYYILCEENCPSLREIGKAFSKVLSDGKVREFDDNMKDLHKAILKTELAANSSFIKGSDDIVCPEGIVECAAKVVDEFRDKNHLGSLKVLVVGPPGSGYTEVANRISQKLGLPLVDPYKLVEAAAKEVGEFGDEIREAIEGDEGKISDATICKVAHKKMSERACRNYGWSMCGFANSPEKAELIFSNEEEEPQSPNFEHIPTHVIILDAKDKELEVIAASKNDNAEEFSKELRKYRISFNAEENILKFFDDRAIPSAIVPAFGEVFDQVYKFLGPKRDFGRPQEEIDAEIAEKERLEREAKEKEEADKKEQFSSETHQWNVGEQIHDVAVKRMEDQDSAFLGEKAAIMQNYLDKEVISHVIAGIVEISKKMPDDPIDALAAFLFAENRKSKK